MTSPQNAAVRAARRLARSGRARAGGLFLVEGPNAVAAAGPALVRLFATAEALPGVAATDAEVLEVSEEVLASLATTVTPQGLVGVASLPNPTLDQALRGARLALVLYEVADPGNLGTIIRTADALGADAVTTSVGSADARNPKAVRASAGSLFGLPVAQGADLDTILDACNAHGLRLVATSPHAGQDCDRVDLTMPIGLVCGNEAHGLPAEVIQRCDTAVRIPLHGSAESLNLAAAVAIVTYEVARQQRRAGAEAQ